MSKRQSTATVYACDVCDKVIPDGERIEGKVVIGLGAIAMPRIWGMWCSPVCFVTQVERAFGKIEHPYDDDQGLTPVETERLA